MNDIPFEIGDVVIYENIPYSENTFGYIENITTVTYKETVIPVIDLKFQNGIKKKITPIEDLHSVKLSKIKKVNFNDIKTDNLIMCKFIAVELMKKYKNRDIKASVYGPSGLRSECSCFIEENGKVIATITLTYNSDGWYSYDTKEIKYTAIPGSVCDLNNLNIITAPLPRDIEKIISIAEDFTL